MSDVFDFLLTRKLDSGHIIDFQPYASKTDALLFTYEELEGVRHADKQSLPVFVFLKSFRSMASSDSYLLSRSPAGVCSSPLRSMALGLCMAWCLVVSPVTAEHFSVNSFRQGLRHPFIVCTPLPTKDRASLVLPSLEELWIDMGTFDRLSFSWQHLFSCRFLCYC